MLKKRENADDIETKLRRMGAKKVDETEFSKSREYSGVYHFVLESLDKGKKTSRVRGVGKAGLIKGKKERA